MKTDITAKIYKKAFGVDLDDKDVNKHVKAVISCKSSMLNPCRVCPAMFFYALGGKSLPARLSIKPFHGGFMSNMISSYLSPTPPKMQALCPAGIHSGIRLLTASWDSNPSVVLTELRTEVSLCWDGSWLYPEAIRTYRPVRAPIISDDLRTFR